MKLTNLLYVVSCHAVTFAIINNLECFEFIYVTKILWIIGHGLLYAIILRWITKLCKDYLINYRVPRTNKAVLITGCDRGFGFMLAKKLYFDGYQVFAGCYCPEDEGAKKLKKVCSGIEIVELDVTKDESVSNALNYVHENLGKSGLWAIVNNAGIFDILDIEFADIQNFQRMFDVNTLGVVRVTKTFLPLLRKSRGRIVTVTSIAGKLSVPCIASYCMSKFATATFCECLRQEMKQWGIKVITIEPELYRTSLISTDVLRSAVDDAWSESGEEIKNVYGENYPEKFKSFIENLIRQANPHVKQVIDCMFDAVTLKMPDYCYKPRKNLIARLFGFLLQYQPRALTDFEFGLTLRLLGCPRPGCSQ